MPEEPPKRKGLLDEMEELEKKRKEKKPAKKKSDDALDLGRIG